MSEAPAVTSAQSTIERVWPEHAAHKSGTRHARWSTAEGVVCACGDVLGWPDPEHPETVAQYTKRIAKEQVDAASAPGRTKGAFGSYSSKTEAAVVASEAVREGRWPVGSTDNPVDVREPGDYSDPEVQTPDGDPGPDGPTDGDPWGDDTPDDEPEPDPAFTDPAVSAARRATGIHAVADVALPADDSSVTNEKPDPWADEAQTESDLPPWSEVDGPPKYAVGDTVTVGGIEFVKHSESPFPEHNAPTPADAAGELADAGREEPSVGQEVVPFRGTPIFPGPEQTLDPLVDRLDPMDPTLEYTPQDVELKIVDIMRAIDRSEVFLRQQVAREHAATHNLDFRYNLAIAKSDARAADQRKAEAWIATERERFEATEASMLVRALRDSQHNLRSVLSGYQSVARSLGVSLSNALDGRGGPGGSKLPPIPTEPPPDPWTS